MNCGDERGVLARELAPMPPCAPLPPTLGESAVRELAPQPLRGTEKDALRSVRRRVDCPVCGSGRTERFLTRRGTPVNQNVVFASHAEAVAIGRADLEMEVCLNCGFVYNAAFDMNRLSYETAYDNNQSHSGSFRGYVGELARNLTDSEGVRDCRIVDVGCGSGDFLRSLVRDAAWNNVGKGFDPAYRGPDCDCEGRARFVRDYFGSDLAEATDVVVCRHVIEHIADPAALLRSVRQALESSRHARAYFETPDVTWILRNRVIWDFFYEHCSLFAPSSIRAAFERSGFRVTGVRRVFCDQYLWLEAALGPIGQTTDCAAGELPALARAFGAREAGLRLLWERTLDSHLEQGKVALWGAGAKGVTLSNLVDPSRRRIDCVVDLNPNKQGRFLPGTGHPIVDYRELKARGVRSAILMNPNYRDESDRLLAAANLQVAWIGCPS